LEHDGNTLISEEAKVDAALDFFKRIPDHAVGACTPHKAGSDCPTSPGPERHQLMFY
jgi:hypothetical protein